MSDELKPCPFCGGSPEVKRHDSEHEPVWCLYTIECPTCQDNYHGSECYGWDLCLCGDDLDKLSEVWNTRAAVTDEQFAMAVNNVEVWQRVRTCRYEPKVHVYYEDWTCSICGHIENNGIGNYCPNCGAKIEGESI